MTLGLNRFLKGRGSTQMANVFLATVCVCNAKCDVTTDILERRNCMIMVYIRIRWRR